MLYIKLKGITKCSNTVANILPADTPQPTLWMGSIGQISTISEHGHVATQVKGNTECGKTEANILPAVPHPDPGDQVNRSNFDFFRTWSCCM